MPCCCGGCDSCLSAQGHPACGLCGRILEENEAGDLRPCGRCEATAVRADLLAEEARERRYEMRRDGE